MTDNRPQTAKEERTRESFPAQRFAIGIISGIFLVVGAGLFLGGDPEYRGLCGLLVRVGLFLGATCLAWDQLLGLPDKLSIMGIAVGIGVLFIAASRPKVFPILFAGYVVALFVNGAIRRFTGAIPGKKRK